MGASVRRGRRLCGLRARARPQRPRRSTRRRSDRRARPDARRRRSEPHAGGRVRTGSARVRRGRREQAGRPGGACRTRSPRSRSCARPTATRRHAASREAAMGTTGMVRGGDGVDRKRSCVARPRPDRTRRATLELVHLLDSSRAHRGRTRVLKGRGAPAALRRRGNGHARTCGDSSPRPCRARLRSTASGAGCSSTTSGQRSAGRPHPRRPSRSYRSSAECRWRRRPGSTSSRRSARSIDDPPGSPARVRRSSPTRVR